MKISRFNLLVIMILLFGCSKIGCENGNSNCISTYQKLYFPYNKGKKFNIESSLINYPIFFSPISPFLYHHHDTVLNMNFLSVLITTWENENYPADFPYEYLSQFDDNLEKKQEFYRSLDFDIEFRTSINNDIIDIQEFSSPEIFVVDKDFYECSPDELDEIEKTNPERIDKEKCLIYDKSIQVSIPPEKLAEGKNMIETSVYAKLLSESPFGIDISDPFLFGSISVVSIASNKYITIRGYNYSKDKDDFKND